MGVEVVLARGRHVGGEDHAVVVVGCAAGSGGAVRLQMRREDCNARGELSVAFARDGAFVGLRLDAGELIASCGGD
jgi:hypothetical protein